MYDQHDTSSHEVVVRSMLEVLQEFGEASESDRRVRHSCGLVMSILANIACIVMKRDPRRPASLSHLDISAWVLADRTLCKQDNVDAARGRE